jgi:hypothetical protein
MVQAEDLFRMRFALEEIKDRNGDGEGEGNAAGQVDVEDADLDDGSARRAAATVVNPTTTTRGEGNSSSDLAVSAPSMQKRTSDALPMRGAAFIRRSKRRSPKQADCSQAVQQARSGVERGGSRAILADENIFDWQGCTIEHTDQFVKRNLYNSPNPSAYHDRKATNRGGR